MGALRPIPFERLVARALRELEREQGIFDLPARKFHTGDPRHDTSCTIHGRRVSAPLGPSAGPHTQMAQNIVLAWLAGARVFELKTVQANDSLSIPRPCIDVRGVGLNVEWSQELRLEESLEEYVKASMLVEMLAAGGTVPLRPGFEHHLFDMSVGYDLAGIRSPRMVAFLRGMLDARPSVDALRRQIPERWRALRDLDFTTRVAPSVTLSTFHGCPPSEIERIAWFLMADLGLDCTIKLNPTLLGAAEVLEVLHDRLGYTHLHVPPAAFDDDPGWEEAAEMVARLAGEAESLGRGFAVKLTNTLIVENGSDFLPRSESMAYLSGAPLHVLALRLAVRFRKELPSLPISFSAGIDRWNYPDVVRAGFAPVTVCTDLLRQGGYGRLQGYASELAMRMDAAGAGTLAEFVTGDAAAALEAAEGDRRYAYRRRPGRERHVPVTATECAMCDLCIQACPNDAMFRTVAPYDIACLDDLCNDCGNCETFCPDGGKPNRDKLRVSLPNTEHGTRSTEQRGAERRQTEARSTDASVVPCSVFRVPCSKAPVPVNFINCLEDP